MRSWFKNQPVIHSFWGDILGLHFVPVVCFALMIINPTFLRGSDNFIMSLPIGIILLFDWGHIFAQWCRIYSNPLETRFSRWGYPLGLVALFFVFFAYLSLGGVGLKVLLTYFVIFHFMKQQFGFVRVLGRAEYRTRPWMRSLEDAYFYLGVVTPVLSWHVQTPAPLVKMPWMSMFIRFSWQAQLYQFVLLIYAAVALVYWFMQLRICREQHSIPVTKYLAILLAHFGWSCVALLPEFQLLFWIMVVFYHNIAYFFIVWATARKDRALITRATIPWWHWTSWLGLPLYIVVVALVADMIGWPGNFKSFNGSAPTLFSLRLFFPRELTADWLPHVSQWLSSIPTVTVNTFGWAWYFAIQGHHYFIDRYLWKKEKVLAWVKRAES